MSFSLIVIPPFAGQIAREFSRRYCENCEAEREEDKLELPRQIKFKARNLFFSLRLAAMSDKRIPVLSALKAFNGKKILIVEDGCFLKNDVRAILVAAGGRVVGPTAMAEDLIYYLRGDIDGAIIDVELPQETVLYISEVLEARAIPFVFAANASTLRDVPSFGGFLLVADTIQLNKIAAALFSNTSPKTLH